MPSNKDFFGSRQEMAVLKHVLLSNYLIPFATMRSTSDTTTPVWYIDAYAGPGRYESKDGSVGEPGSPLIALGAANTVSKLSRPRILNCIFIEQKKAYWDTLTSICETGRFAGTHRTINADAHSSFEQAVVSTSGQPLLAFIDPFGTALPFAVLQAAFKERFKSATTEVLLNFHLSSVARIGALMGQANGLSPTDQKTVARLDAFLGFDWTACFLDVYDSSVKHSATRGAMAVADAFRAMVLRTEGYRSMAIDVRKANDGVPRFQLTLFYRHDAAEYKFADAAAAANKAWRQRISEQEARRTADQHPDMLLPMDFDEKQFEDQWKRGEKDLGTQWEKALQANILESLRQRTSIKVSASVRVLYGDLLGMAGEKHLRAAWKLLALRGLTSTYNPEMMYATITRGPEWSGAG